MQPQQLVVPVSILFMLLAVVLGAFRLLTQQGITLTPLGFLQVHHGELIVFGFLAPLLMTERYLGATAFSLSPAVRFMPFLAVAGVVLKLVYWFTIVYVLNVLATLAVAVAVVMYIYLLVKVSRQSAQPLPFQYMVLGALALLAGVIIALVRSPVANPAFTLLLISFPVLTIIGERVELSRFLSPRAHARARWGFWAAAAASLLLVIRTGGIGGGYLLMAWAVLLALAAAPLLRPELTLVRLGQRGLHRYLGRHLVMAYIWLLVGLVIILLGGERYPLYDAGAHAVAIGFVFTMIFAHAPVIAPVILNGAIREERLGYYPLALLSLSVVMRVVGQALNTAGVSVPAMAGLSGVIALIAIITFVIMMKGALRPA